jgi:hypothetical protein
VLEGILLFFNVIQQINFCYMSYIHVHFLNLPNIFHMVMHNIITILCDVTLSGLLGNIKIETADSP